MPYPSKWFSYQSEMSRIHEQDMKQVESFNSSFNLTNHLTNNHINDFTTTIFQQEDHHNDVDIQLSSMSIYDTTPSITTNRVYIGNLSFSLRWQDVKDAIRDATGLECKVEILRWPTAAQSIKQIGRSKGCAIAEFHSISDAQLAIERCNDQEVGGRKIFVREDREAGRLMTHDQRQSNPSVYDTFNQSNNHSYHPTLLLQRGPSIYDHTPHYRGNRHSHQFYHHEPIGMINSLVTQPIQPTKSQIAKQQLHQQSALHSPESKQSNNQSINQSNNQIDHHHIPLHEQQTTNSIFFGNLSWQTTTETLNHLLVQTIQELDSSSDASSETLFHVDIAVGRDGRNRGFATVQCDVDDHVDMLINRLNGVNFEGRNIAVRRDRPNRRYHNQQHVEHHHSISQSINQSINHSFHSNQQHVSQHMLPVASSYSSHQSWLS